MRRKVIIAKGAVGPNVSGKPFKTSGLLTTGVAVADKLDLGTTYPLYSVEDCEALGLNAAYDTTNNVVVYEHISEFYRLAGAGVPLYLMVVAQTVTLADMIDDAGGSYLYARKLIVDANGEIHNLAIGFNPAVGYTETSTDGLNSEVRACIVKAQALHQWTYDTDRPVEILLEGRAISGNATSALNLRAIPTTSVGILQADRVSIVIGQDYVFASSLTGLAQKHAAIGTALGCEAAIEVNQCIGEVATMNLTDELRGKWTVAGLSSHVTTKSVESQLDTYDTKGYLFGDTYSGASGYRWNGDPTCAPVILDAVGNMNAHTRAYGRAMDFAVRKLREVLVLLINAVRPVDVATGRLPVGIRKEIEGQGNTVFEDMAAKGWLSAGEMVVDPTSDILVEKKVKVSFSLVPYGTIGEISGKINLKTKF